MTTNTTDFFALANAVSATLDNLWSAWFRQHCHDAGIAAPTHTQPAIATAHDEEHARALAAHLDRDPAVFTRVLFVEANKQWIVSVALNEVPVRCEDVVATLANTTH